MRVISPDLYNEVQEGNICNVMKITLQNGTVYGYTDFDEAITVDGIEYIPAPGLQKVRMTLTSTSEVSNQELASAWVDAPEEDLMSGKFDSANINVGWASWVNPQFGIFSVFTGKLGEISWTDAGFKADIFSNMKDLERNIGAVFTANCRHSLYSVTAPGLIGHCGVNKASFTESGSISAIIKQRWKFQMSISQATNYFSTGELTFTSGANAGLTYGVKSQDGSTIELFFPTSFLVAPSDTFTISAGCDRTMATCKSKFNNLNNFGGFPHIQPDVSFR